MHGIIGYQDAKVLQITYWMTSVIASLIPIGSIIVLYKVHSMAARLGIIAGFNVLVSLCLSIFTDAKRAEVFAITAALATQVSVLVKLTRGQFCRRPGRIRQCRQILIEQQVPLYFKNIGRSVRLEI